MDTLSSLVCLITGSALTLLTLGLMVRRGVRQLSVASAYRDVAQDLGLQIDTRGVSVHGHLGDRRIWIGEVMEGHGTDRRVEIRGVLSLERPLGLGMTLKRRGRTNRLLRRRGAAASIGEADLDRLLDVRADEPTHVPALFTAEVREALARIVKLVPELVVTDEELQVWLKSPPDSAGELHELVQAMVALAERLERARREVVVPSALEPTVDAWRDLGSQLQVDVVPWLPALSGHFDGHRLLVVVQREAEGYSATLQLWFHAHPELGLLLRPQVEPDSGYWSVGQDIQVGDTAFDDAFVVKGWDPSAVTARLGANARERLMELRKMGRLVVDDRGLVLRGLPIDPPALGKAVHAAASTARALGW